MESSSPPPAPQTPPAVCWSAVLQKKPAPAPEEPISSRVFGSCKSSKGISVAVVDANAIIHGDKLVGSADKFVSVHEVLDEVRDPASRHRLAFLPIHVETMEPSPLSIKKVVKFARETGDLQTLSDVDLKLIALTYMLESQIHGTHHLRDSPPPLHVVNVKSLPEAEMPGWGSNVPNIAEWEALEHIGEEGLDNRSRILPLKDLSNNVSPSAISDSILEAQAVLHQSSARERRFTHRGEEIKIDGKKMVVDGIDASQGQDCENADEWRPAVSRSTHRRYLRRKARREMYKELEGNDEPFGHDSTIANDNDNLSDDQLDGADELACKVSEGTQTENKLDENDESLEGNFVNCELSTTLDHMKLDDTSAALHEKHCIPGGVAHPVTEESYFGNLNVEEDENNACSRELHDTEILSLHDTEESIDGSLVDDGSSEQSWMLRSLSDSTVACITRDYAMQNVILQIGLRLLAPGGMQIRQLHRWVLRCHACNEVTQDIGRLFCPKCGNGGTLRKVSVTVGESGIVLAARRQRVILRGTKFSLPLPQGGRDGITKNPILREDQLPRKMLYPKAKKKSNKKEDDFLGSDDIFTHAGERRAPWQPPVRQALQVFRGRRNPNDNHFSRSKR